MLVTEAQKCREVPGAAQAHPLREAELLMARMKRAEQLCNLQSSFVHPLNFQESLVCASALPGSALGHW